jgi:hypothetical protein
MQQQASTLPMQPQQRNWGNLIPTDFLFFFFALFAVAVSQPPTTGLLLLLRDEWLGSG